MNNIHGRIKDTMRKEVPFARMTLLCVHDVKYRLGLTSYDALNDLHSRLLLMSELRMLRTIDAIRSSMEE